MSYILVLYSQSKEDIHLVLAMIKSVLSDFEWVGLSWVSKRENKTDFLFS